MQAAVNCNVGCKTSQKSGGCCAQISSWSNHEINIRICQINLNHKESQLSWRTCCKFFIFDSVCDRFKTGITIKRRTLLRFYVFRKHHKEHQDRKNKGDRSYEADVSYFSNF